MVCCLLVCLIVSFFIICACLRVSALLSVVGYLVCVCLLFVCLCSCVCCFFFCLWVYLCMCACSFDHLLFFGAFACCLFDLLCVGCCLKFVVPCMFLFIYALIDCFVVCLFVVVCSCRYI